MTFCRQTFEVVSQCEFIDFQQRFSFRNAQGAVRPNLLNNSQRNLRHGLQQMFSFDFGLQVANLFGE